MLHLLNFQITSLISSNVQVSWTYKTKRFKNTTPWTFWGEVGGEILSGRGLSDVHCVCQESCEWICFCDGGAIPQGAKRGFQQARVTACWLEQELVSQTQSQNQKTMMDALKEMKKTRQSLQWIHSLLESFLFINHSVFSNYWYLINLILGAVSLSSDESHSFDWKSYLFMSLMSGHCTPHPTDTNKWLFLFLFTQLRTEEKKSFVQNPPFNAVPDFLFKITI